MRQHLEFINDFTVVPSLPKKLEHLRQLAVNLRWSWDHETQNLFRRLDPDLWEQTHHNPVMMLGKVSQTVLHDAARNDGFLTHLKRSYEKLNQYLTSPTWFSSNFPAKNGFEIAYFSFEFGLTECLQTYSGGLGILAGDHLKSASDLGLPLIGVGINFKDGFFQQYLNSDGWQQERYNRNDFENQPMTLIRDHSGNPLTLALDFPGRKVTYQIWRIDVGRVPLYLLDTDIEQNSSADRRITERLYGGGSEMRIQQEIILGIGGLQAISALGINPAICHMNEGHSAFLSLERIRKAMETYRIDFNTAKEAGFHTNIFTTHTPVPAGIDVFDHSLVKKYFDSYRQSLGLSESDFYDLGTLTLDASSQQNFNMAHLAMNTAGYTNGVSRLHETVSKKMWAGGFESIPLNEIPISHVTNGIHIRSHLAPEMEELLTRYLGERWLDDPSAEGVWNSVEDIPDEELWRIHERRRERLVAFARKKLAQQIISRGGGHEELRNAKEVLNPSVLTIGFARRFATYKRATLIFRDLERLQLLLSDAKRPVQIIIAGKAHPKDDEGKAFIQAIFKIARTEDFRRRVVFLENYDMNVARYLVEGCDVWLNNPRRPLEASGTSGMKVIANGGLNFSVLDGWWDEAFEPSLGWKIGNREEYSDPEIQDEIESREIYNSLENEIVHTFYSRTDDGLPRRWIRMMKNSMKTLAPIFNTNRMVKEYLENLYIPAYERREQLMKDNWQAAKKLSAWKNFIFENWDSIQLEEYSFDKEKSAIKFGDHFSVHAKVSLGRLTPEDVSVEVYYGVFSKSGTADTNSVQSMKLHSTVSEGTHLYYTSVPCKETGKIGFTIRIVPKHPLLINPFEMGLVFWADKNSPKNHL